MFTNVYTPKNMASKYIKRNFDRAMRRKRQTYNHLSQKLLQVIMLLESTVSLLTEKGQEEHRRH